MPLHMSGTRVFHFLCTDHGQNRIRDPVRLATDFDLVGWWLGREAA